MFMADMYCYGKDADCAGITGIEGCLGLIIYHNNMFYAIHIPPSATGSKYTMSYAIEQFKSYVIGQDATIQGGANVLLYGITNRDFRSSAEDDIRYVCAQFGLPKCFMIRFRKTPKGKTLSTATICARLPWNNQLHFQCQADSTVLYTETGATQRHDSYKPWFAKDRRANRVAGWWPIDQSNAEIIRLKM